MEDGYTEAKLCLSRVTQLFGAIDNVEDSREVAFVNSISKASIHPPVNRKKLGMHWKLWPA